MTETQNQNPAPETKVITDVNEPSLSFSDYQKLRRGEKVEVTSAPVEKTEQKEPKESETLETEAKETEVESEESDEAEESGKDKTKKKGGFQRRIDKLNAAKADAQREAEYWRGLALKNQETPQEQQSKAPESKAKASDDKEPQPEDFETHREYVNALTDWKLDLREKKSKVEAEKKAVIAEQEKSFKAYNERKDAFAKTVDDFDEVLDDVRDVQVTPAITATIVESEYGPQLAYELAKNRAEFERIVKLSPLAAAREIGKIEAKIAAKASEPKETKKITSAPKPIEPVGGTKGKPNRSIRDPDLSFADYVELRRAQMKRR